MNMYCNNRKISYVLRDIGLMAVSALDAERHRLSSYGFTGRPRILVVFIDHTGRVYIFNPDVFDDIDEIEGVEIYDSDTDSENDLNLDYLDYE